MEQKKNCKKIYFMSRPEIYSSHARMQEQKENELFHYILYLETCVRFCYFLCLKNAYYLLTLITFFFYLSFAFPSSVIQDTIVMLCCFSLGFPFLINVGLFPKAAICIVVNVLFLLFLYKKESTALLAKYYFNICE